MERSDRDKTGQSEDHGETAIARTTDRVSEYHFFIKRDIQSGEPEVSGKDAEGGEKKETEKERSLNFFLSDR